MRPVVLTAYVNNELRRQRALAVKSVTPPAISGTAAAGNTLAVSDGTWTSRDNDLLSFSYQWYLDGVAIAGEVASTYDVVGGDSGHYIACRVKATHPVGRPGFASAAALATAVLIA